MRNAFGNRPCLFPLMDVRTFPRKTRENGGAEAGRTPALSLLWLSFGGTLHSHLSGWQFSYLTVWPTDRHLANLPFPKFRRHSFREGLTWPTSGTMLVTSADSALSRGGNFEISRFAGYCCPRIPYGSWV